MPNSRETQLHCAVLADDYTSVKALSKIPALANSTNFLGLTSLELAQYLGKQTSERLLSLYESRRIPVMKPGAKQHEFLSRAQFKYFFHVTYCPHLFFPDYLLLQSVLKECPWTLRKSFLGEENRLQGEQYKRELSEGVVANVAIQWINADLGFGLFALQDIPAHTYVGEFTGLVRRLSRKKPDQNAYCFHYPTRFWSWNYTVVDALAYGNETRFINHSDHPNLNPLCICERNFLHIVFITKEFVLAGTQLTYDYGKDFWKQRQKIQI